MMARGWAHRVMLRLTQNDEQQNAQQKNYSWDEKVDV
jgi:hypothetical protein